MIDRAPPTFTHDCHECRYLGAVVGPNPCNTQDTSDERFELYVCARSDGGSVIARRSSEPSDYASSPRSLLHANTHPALLWANALLQMEELRGGES